MQVSNYLEDNISKIDDKVEAALELIHTMKQMHGEGVIHRDLKPDNILVKKDDQGTHLIITDLGSGSKAGFTQTYRNIYRALCCP